MVWAVTRAYFKHSVAACHFGRYGRIEVINPTLWACVTALLCVDVVFSIVSALEALNPLSHTSANLTLPNGERFPLSQYLERSMHLLLHPNNLQVPTKAPVVSAKAQAVPLKSPAVLAKPPAVIPDKQTWVPAKAPIVVSIAKAPSGSNQTTGLIKD
ncbi:unnamed protein product [Sphagnum balticum]